jgi:hypothetical protein
MTRNDLEMKITYSIHNLICGNTLCDNVLRNNNRTIKDIEMLGNIEDFKHNTIKELSNIISEYELSNCKPYTILHKLQISLKGSCNFTLRMSLEAYKTIKDILDTNYKTNWFSEQVCIITY